MTAQRVLDQAYSLAGLARLEPEAYVEALAAEVADDLEARDGQLVAALAAVDAMIARAMRIRLDHALADDASLPAVTRNVFATTIVKYAGALDLLAERVRDVALRGRARDPDAVAMAVLDAARDVLALRDRLRVGVLELARTLAAAAIEPADRHARDRRLDDAARVRWSKVRRALEAVAADPSVIVTAAWRDRLAALDDQLDDPPAEREPTFADMIELD
ncbi:MAG TPA: hypothetical protein VFP84_27320 [Kofleriaceae bacterium]|nr:hypothetical protein [Kofleriaceae bacterium]